MIDAYCIAIYVIHLVESFKFYLLFPFMFLAIPSLSLTLQHVFSWCMNIDLFNNNMVFWFKLIENQCSFKYTFIMGFITCL